MLDLISNLSVPGLWLSVFSVFLKFLSTRAVAEGETWRHKWTPHFLHLQVVLMSHRRQRLGGSWLCKSSFINDCPWSIRFITRSHMTLVAIFGLWMSFSRRTWQFSSIILNLHDPLLFTFKKVFKILFVIVIRLIQDVLNILITVSWFVVHFKKWMWGSSPEPYTMLRTNRNWKSDWFQLVRGSWMTLISTPYVLLSKTCGKKYTRPKISYVLCSKTYGHRG